MGTELKRNRKQLRRFTESKLMYNEIPEVERSPSLTDV